MGETGKISSLPFTRGGLGWGNLRNNSDSIAKRSVGITCVYRQIKLPPLIPPWKWGKPENQVPSPWKWGKPENQVPSPWKWGKPENQVPSPLQGEG